MPVPSPDRERAFSPPDDTGAGRDAARAEVHSVLVVESPNQMRRLRQLLSQARELAGVRFEAAGSTDLARAILRLRDFDAVVIDASIPRLPEALSSLRAEPRASGLPILVTGEAGPGGMRGVPDHELARTLRQTLGQTPGTPTPVPGAGPTNGAVSGPTTGIIRRDPTQELTALLSATTAPMLGLDDRGNCIYANDAAARLFACDAPGELVGKAGAELVPNSVIEVGHGDILRFDGNLAPVAATVATPGPVSGRLAKVITLADRTLEHRQQERLFLAQKMVAMGELTGGICHDFANLLTVVCGNLSEIVKSPDLTSDVHEMAEDALSAAVDGLNLTRRLVTVARERQMRPRAVDIGATVGEFGRLLKRLVRRPAELDVRAEEGVHAILDRTQLESAVLNLVLNAQHALPSGGRITLSIDTTTAREVGREVKLARVTVRDEGMGMDEETRLRATEAFYTTRADAGGTGLGLAMVASFCRSFGGQLQIQSALGSGTSVILTFPWVPEASPRTQLFPKEVEEKRLPSRRALVVVPDPRLRRYAARLLSAAGHLVTELEDAAGVIEHVMSRPPDVILLDQPVASQRVPSSLARAVGPMSRPLELLAWLGLTRPELPVIVTTHDEPARDPRTGQPEGGRNERQAPAVAMLRKPYSEAELARILQLLTRP